MHDEINGYIETMPEEQRHYCGAALFRYYGFNR
jgi:hypothetical protein